MHINSNWLLHTKYIVPSTVAEEVFEFLDELEDIDTSMVDEVDVEYVEYVAIFINEYGEVSSYDIEYDENQDDIVRDFNVEPENFQDYETLLVIKEKIKNDE